MMFEFFWNRLSFLPSSLHADSIWACRYPSVEACQTPTTGIQPCIHLLTLSTLFTPGVYMYKERKTLNLPHCDTKWACLNRVVPKLCNDPEVEYPRHTATPKLTHQSVCTALGNCICMDICPSLRSTRRMFTPPNTPVYFSCSQRSKLVCASYCLRHL